MGLLLQTAASNLMLNYVNKDKTTKTYLQMKLTFTWSPEQVSIFAYMLHLGASTSFSTLLIN